MAEAETRPERKAELLQIAGICEHVPEHPARTFHEALQSMAIVGVCKLYEHPMHNNPQWGRGDQYLYPYFIRDINSGTITLEKAAELLAELVGRWGTQTFVASESLKESHQINFGINNIMIGGVDQIGGGPLERIKLSLSARRSGSCSCHLQPWDCVGTRLRPVG